jgi:AcrR family transcriptional regulator
MKKTVNKSAKTKPNKRKQAAAATQKRLLLAAERLFSECGYEGASARDICSRAKVDLAMINYHFGSKLGLYRTLFLRRGEALNNRRLEELDRVMETAKGRPELAGLVRALVGPNIQLRNDAKLGGLAFARIIAHELIDPTAKRRNLIEQVFGKVAERFIEALSLALPHASRAELHWAYHFTIGTLVLTMANNGRIEKLSDGACQVSDVERVLDHLVPFVAHGILGCVGKPGAAQAARPDEAVNEAINDRAAGFPKQNRRPEQIR